MQWFWRKTKVSFAKIQDIYELKCGIRFVTGANAVFSLKERKNEKLEEDDCGIAVAGCHDYGMHKGRGKGK
jgi:hypothetical protein